MRILKQYPFSKVGLNEIQGLKPAMLRAVKPIQAWLKESIYWDLCEPAESEYNSRDGFIPHSHNCGGLEFSVIIPSCERYEFDFLEFGECDECGKDTKAGDPLQCGYQGQECDSESEGHLDAKLRIWFKFEGLEDGTMTFWLYAGGGNGDAPYFRTQYETDLFEASFTAKTLTEFKIQAARAVKRMIKELSK